MLTFREKMNMYDKESLKSFAFDLGLSRVSQLKKADLIEKIAEEVLEPDKLFYRLAVLSDEEFDLFSTGSRESIKLGEHDPRFDTACRLNERELGALDHEHWFSTLSDIWDVFETLDREEFDAYRAKASWVWKCLDWVDDMYALAPVDVVLKLINQKKGFSMDYDSLREMYLHFPNDFPQILMLGNTFVRDYLATDKKMAERVGRAQAGKDYYIPGVDEIEEYAKVGALLSKKPYRELFKYLTEEIGMDKQDADDLLYDLWQWITIDDDPQGTIRTFFDRVGVVEKEHLNELVSRYMDATNATNRWSNRGWAPADLFKHQKLDPSVRPTIVPGSSNAAKMLAEAMPDLKKMGLNVDLDSNATNIPVFSMPAGVGGPIQTGQKKIYPNDPCPCGSGKKFKKCCGR